MKLYYFNTSGYMPIEIMEAEVEEETPKTYVLKCNWTINKSTMVCFDYHYSTTYEGAVKAAIECIERHIFSNYKRVESLLTENKRYLARIAELKKILEENNGQ